MRARLVPALVALAALAVGCSEGGDGETSPTLPPVTAAPSESPTAEAVPNEATAATPEGAAEFVRFFYETVEQSYQSQDPNAVRSLSAEGCMACKAFIDTIEGLRADGAKVREDYAVEVVSVEAPGLVAGQTSLTALAIIDVAEFVRLGADGQVTTREPALDDVAQNVTLRRDGASWQVEEMTQP